MDKESMHNFYRQQKEIEKKYKNDVEKKKMHITRFERPYFIFSCPFKIRNVVTRSNKLLSD